MRSLLLIHFIYMDSNAKPAPTFPRTSRPMVQPRREGRNLHILQVHISLTMWVIRVLGLWNTKILDLLLPAHLPQQIDLETVAIPIV